MSNNSLYDYELQIWATTGVSLSTGLPESPWMCPHAGSAAGIPTSDEREGRASDTRDRLTS